MGSVTTESALLRLTPRDRLLLTILDEVRYLTVHQIRQTCFPSLSAGVTSHRLSLLRKRGVLECLAHRAFDDRRAFWGLSPLGRFAAAAIAGAATARGRVFEAAVLQMDHLIGTNQVFCDLCVERRSGRLRPCRWFGSHHTRIDLGSTHLVPDALILVDGPEGHRWMYCLELDRSTMAPGALIEKFERYRRMYALAQERRDDPVWNARADAWLLFACDDRRRTAEAARLAAGCGLERVWAGSPPECAACLAATVGPGAEAVPIAPLADLPGGVPLPAEAGAPSRTPVFEVLP